MSNAFETYSPITDIDGNYSGYRDKSRYNTTQTEMNALWAVMALIVVAAIVVVILWAAGVFNGERYTVGGSIIEMDSELEVKLTLTINGHLAETRTFTAEGPFVFTKKLADRDTYQVANASLDGVTVDIVNGVGTMGTANVADIEVTVVVTPAPAP